MKVTIKKLRESGPALDALSGIQFPAKVSYRISRVYSSAQSVLKPFQEAHLELIKKHGGTENESGQLEVPKAKLPEFLPEFEELLSVEEDVWGDPIVVELLGDAEIAPAILVPLDWLFSDGSSEPEKPKAAAASGD